MDHQIKTRAETRVLKSQSFVSSARGIEMPFSFFSGHAEVKNTKDGFDDDRKKGKSGAPARGDKI